MVHQAVQQLYPSLSERECEAWLAWARQQSNYHICRVGQAGCITKYYDQIDPPWKRVAHEVAWWGYGRDAVRALHRGMDWARLQGATDFGYSLAPHYEIVKWRRL